MIDNNASQLYYPDMNSTSVESSIKLNNLISEKISSTGKITFAEYMRMCLYEPLLGYYTSSGRKVGAEGDFYTSSNVNAAFGRLIGKELESMWESLCKPEHFTICEIGAGSGRLASDILDSIAVNAPLFYSCLTYLFIEIEPSLQVAQKNSCCNHEEKLSWLSPGSLFSGENQITGCILSNELIDSFPVHIVEMTDDGLKEVYVTLKDGEFAENMGELSDTEIPLYFARLGIWIERGQRAEVNLNAIKWIQNAARALKSGFILTIDYGYEAKELFAPFRKNGTLLCYYRHQTAEDPYIRAGEQDITSHVDFTTLKLAGGEAGLETVWYGEQYRFLMACGMMDEMLVIENSTLSEPERFKTILALKKLILPEGGMGDTFKVLIQSKGLKSPKLLSSSDWTKRSF